MSTLIRVVLLEDRSSDVVVLVLVLVSIFLKEGTSAVVISISSNVNFGTGIRAGLSFRAPSTGSTTTVHVEM